MRTSLHLLASGRWLRLLLAATALGSLSLVLSGCGSLGGLRRDVSEEARAYSPAPTRGGQFAELGYLDDDDYENEPGGRRPASAGLAGGMSSRGRRSWVSDDQEESNRREQMRGRGLGEGGDDELAIGEDGAFPLARQRAMGGVPGRRVTRADFLDRSKDEGSLWASDGQSNFFFSKNRIRTVGDLVTIQLEAPFVKDVVTEVTRTLSESDREAELMLAQERLKAQAYGLPEPMAPGMQDQTASNAPDASGRAPASAGGNVSNQQQAGSTADAAKKDIKVAEATYNDINVAKSLAIKSGDTIMAEIVERYPNGNYKVRGTKRIRYRDGFRLVRVVGVVKGSDITEDDQVTSGKLYEYRLEAQR